MHHCFSVAMISDVNVVCDLKLSSVSDNVIAMGFNVHNEYFSTNLYLVFFSGFHVLCWVLCWRLSSYVNNMVS